MTIGCRLMRFSTVERVRRLPFCSHSPLPRVRWSPPNCRPIRQPPPVSATPGDLDYLLNDTRLPTSAQVDLCTDFQRRLVCCDRPAATTDPDGEHVTRSSPHTQLSRWTPGTVGGAPVSRIPPGPAAAPVLPRCVLSSGADWGSVATRFGGHLLGLINIGFDL